MQCKPEIPTRSISELLALFMRQAAVEVAAKRAEVRRITPDQQMQIHRAAR